MRCNSFVSRLLGLLALLLLLPQQSVAEPVTIFSGSPLYRTPETISQAPAVFGAFGGEYFIPDFNRGALNGNIWRVPSAGGPPISFASNADYVSLGGLFLPETGWGANSGRFLATGRTASGPGVIYTYAPDGTRSLFVSGGSQFSQPRLAPAGFGAYAGQLIVGDGAVRAVTSAGMVSTVADPPSFSSWFGLAFAPAAFGALGGDLFISNAGTNEIDVVRGNGTFSPFATIPLQPGQTGLRQLEFSPSGFLPGFGELLFVSVSGSPGGGGTLGDVLALDNSGQIVASLRTDLGLQKFDPRGLYFVDNQHLLVSDASDPILLATPDAFQPSVVPEPTTFSLLGIGILGLLAYTRRWRRVAGREGG